jgi:hypothetical protein
MSIEGISESTKGFAELMNNFNKLTEIESRIETAIKNSKVPWQETRKFLKGMTLNQVLNTPLSQFIQDLFDEIGLGRLELSQKDNFQYVYKVEKSPICNLFRDIQDKKVCEPTVDAIYRFFSEDLGLESEVEETKCLNIGDDFCEFEMELQPFHVFAIALDKTDIDILKEVLELETVKISKLAEQLQLDDDELIARITLLQYYELLNENYTITEVGRTFYKYRQGNPPKEEEYFDPPWKSMAELTSTIAATQSFAEALVVISEEEKLPWEVDESELVDIKEKAKDKTSFAELLSSELKKETKSEEDEEEEEE